MAVLLAAAGCSYNVGATFNVDGSVTLGLKFLLPKSLLEGGPGITVHGFSPAEIAQANAEAAKKYPGAAITTVTEGDEAGVVLTIPFKTEKDAFAFLTQPSKLNPSGVTSGGSTSIDVGNTGGIFVSAAHTTTGQTDVYTFKTQAQPTASPSPGQPAVGADVLESIIGFKFSLTVPREITSAPGALFTQDRKTAIWTLSLTQPQTLTATTSPSVALAGVVSDRASAQNLAALIGIGLAAVALAFFIGLVTPWRLRHPAEVEPGSPEPPSMPPPPTAP